MLQTAFRPSCMNRASVFEWHKGFKEGRESMRDDERCGRSKEVNTPELEASTLQIGSVTFPPGLAPVHNSILVTDRGCHYETIEEMKEAVTKVIDMLPQEDFHGAFQKLLERYNKCIAAGGDYFKGD